MEQKQTAVATRTELETMRAEMQQLRLELEEAKRPSRTDVETSASPPTDAPFANPARSNLDRILYRVGQF